MGIMMGMRLVRSPSGRVVGSDGPSDGDGTRSTMLDAPHAHRHGEAT